MILSESSWDWLYWKSLICLHSSRKESRKERPCGLWDVQVSDDMDHETTGNVVYLTKWFTSEKKKAPKEPPKSFCIFSICGESMRP
jgi:hypothetical protein